MSARDEILAEVSAGDVGQVLVLGAERLLELLLEQVADVRGRKVQGGRDDVDRVAGGPVARCIRPRSVSTGRTPSGLQRVVQLESPR